MSFWKSLKHIFVPHEGNDFKPHFFREFSILLILGAISLITLASIQITNLLQSGNLAAIYTSEIIGLTNNDRGSYALRPLTQNSLLALAAELKAKDMASKGYFAHISPDGRSPWTFISQSGYKFVYAGENLAMDFTDSIDVERAWMNSPGHRANILGANYTEIGVATSRGMYQGREVTYVVQMFGSPPFVSEITLPEKIVVDTSTSSAPIASEKIEQVVIVASSTKTITKINNSSDTEISEIAILGASSTETISKKDEALKPAEISTSTREVEGDFIAFVSNADQGPKIPWYKSAYQRILGSPGTSLGLVYLALAVFISLAIIIFGIFEWRMRHPKNIFYGILLVIILLLLFYISHSVFYSEVLVV